jgi:hypothetical protein
MTIYYIDKPSLWASLWAVHMLLLRCCMFSWTALVLTYFNRIFLLPVEKGEWKEARATLVKERKWNWRQATGLIIQKRIDVAQCAN